eukprot:SAG31_NODE_40534_length_280_cov_0.834254_1_plen_56_part_01
MVMSETGCAVLLELLALVRPPHPRKTLFESDAHLWHASIALQDAVGKRQYGENKTC